MLLLVDSDHLPSMWKKGKQTVYRNEIKTSVLMITPIVFGQTVWGNSLLSSAYRTSIPSTASSEQSLEKTQERHQAYSDLSRFKSYTGCSHYMFPKIPLDGDILKVLSMSHCS